MAAASQALFEQGNAHMHAGEPLLARACYERAIELDPNLGDAHFNLGATYQAQSLHHLALKHYERGVALMADPSIYLGNVLNTKMRICDWNGLNPLIKQIESRVLGGQKTCPPFQIISFSGSLDVQQKAASLWVEAYPALPRSDPFRPRKKQAGEKIRIAYFSADFHNHPVAYLTAEMFELHNKAQFELIAFSNGHASEGDPYRTRVMGAFNQFIDIRAMRDEDVVLLARQMEIDVAVDLTSLTQGGRTNILMARVAPVQMHYLGYPATTSAANVDYMIADEMLVPKAMQQYYSEKILYLPHCFQVSDRHRPAASPISDRPASRKALGLSEGSFVFCSFCNSYKITPEVFDSWMRILQATPQSMLMLYADSEVAQSNLRREAQERGVDANRIVFGTRVGIPDYLARLTNCDLFLDTLPYNGGTTANDVLWMGLPLLTIKGETMTSRMAASLLHTLDLDALIATNWSDYENKAIQLATQNERYTAIKQRLHMQREVSPLFDTTRTTRHIEHGYCLALERYWQGLAPDHLYVPA
jgi:predicted O-linked N-acetylglucosamine transferase (SPINDLY family)